MKATANADRRKDGLHFRLKRKDYNDLAMTRAVPLLLVVLELPTEESAWVGCDPKRLVMRRCGWWISLEGSDTLDAGSKTVVIPRAQRIGSSGLAPLFGVREPAA